MLDPQLKLSLRGMTTTGYPKIYNTKVEIFWANFLISKLYSRRCKDQYSEDDFQFLFLPIFQKM